MEKDALMTIRLPVATREALRRAADADRRTMSSMAVLIMEEWLRNRRFLRKPGGPGPKRGGAA